MLKDKKTWLRLILIVTSIVVVLTIVSTVVINNMDDVPVFVEIPTDPTAVTDPPTVAEIVMPAYDPYQTMRWDDPAEELMDTRPRSLLTGLPMDEEYVTRRPVAVVINNLFQAHPQSGITSADVIYEVLAEGDVTRLVGIFQSYLPEKIGPVRSARDSFIDFAFNHDAIFVHHGRSPDANTRLNATGITNLDGMALEGTVFWRDRTYPEWHRNSGTRPLEHSSYTGWERIQNHMTSRNIREYINDSPAYGFTFGVVAAQPAGVANVVRVPFSVPYTRTFIFDPDLGAYMVENRDGALQDAETADQVAVHNILIQLTTLRVTGTLGQRTVGTVGEGEGFWVTGGKYHPVRWAKDSHTSPMRWYHMDGSPLALTPGVTWICVFQSSGTVVFED